MKTVPVEPAHIDFAFANLGEVSRDEMIFHGITPGLYRQIIETDLAGGRGFTALVENEPVAVYVEATYSSFVSTNAFFNGVRAEDFGRALRAFNPGPVLARSAARTHAAQRWMQRIGFAPVRPGLFFRKGAQDVRELLSR